MSILNTINKKTIFNDYKNDNNDLNVDEYNIIFVNKKKHYKNEIEKNIFHII